MEYRKASVEYEALHEIQRSFLEYQGAFMEYQEAFVEIHKFNGFLRSSMEYRQEAFIEYKV